VQKNSLIQNQSPSQVQPQYVEKSEKLAIQNELLELNERILQRDDLLMKKENELKLYKQEIEALRDDCLKSQSKLKAIELYASEL
jgi:hypothetical protein